MLHTDMKANCLLLAQYIASCWQGDDEKERDVKFLFCMKW